MRAIESGDIEDILDTLSGSRRVECNSTLRDIGGGQVYLVWIATAGKGDTSGGEGLGGSVSGPFYKVIKHTGIVGVARHFKPDYRPLPLLVHALSVTAGIAAILHSMRLGSRDSRQEPSSVEPWH
ncbi:MAG: hypothetical protein F7C38_01165 [Desulfurococcales archaeon]|nr:hypothetical protein [Desulfurococcales archaeon]